MGGRKNPGDEKKKGGLMRKALALAGLSVLGWLLGPKTDEAEYPEDKVAGERKFRRLIIQGWMLVCALSIVLVLYGFFAFFVVGDKGPPDWDFGDIPSVPGESPYSTHPSSGRPEGPDVQHVDERPRGVQNGGKQVK